MAREAALDWEREGGKGDEDYRVIEGEAEVGEREEGY